MSSPARPVIGARLRQWTSTLRHYHEIAEVGEIARRYFPMNAFDGVLTALGIVTGAYFGGVTEPRSLVLVISSASLSLGVSGFYGSYISEQAERSRGLRELEDTMLTPLDSTEVSSAARYAAIAIAFVAGFASAIGGLLMCVPLLLQSFLGINGAFYGAWVVALVELVLLGLFLGRVSRGRVVVMVVKLVLAGAVAFGLSLLLEAAGV